MKTMLFKKEKSYVVKNAGVMGNKEKNFLVWNVLAFNNFILQQIVRIIYHFTVHVYRSLKC